MLSAPTVYNYFGSKAGIVVAIIIEADEALFAKADALIDRADGDPVEDMTALLSLIVNESLKTFDAQTWRHVFAIAILEREDVIGTGYGDQNVRLYDRCEELLAKCIAAGNLPGELDLKPLRGLCEHLNHALFEQLVSGEIQTFGEYEVLLQEYLEVFL
jgi:AcrR family transcriptional regulator